MIGALLKEWGRILTHMMGYDMEVLDKEVTSVTTTFRGGIQKGTIATDAAALRLDKQCKYIRDVLAAELSSEYGSRLVLKKTLKGTSDRCGCSPDGGLWYYDGVLIAAFEGKKQGSGGNAIERWYKNQYICRTITNPKVSYTTFAIGSGATTSTPIGRTLVWAHEVGFNVSNTFGNSCYMKPEGFTDAEVYSIMRSTIVDTISSIEGRCQ